MTEPIIRCHQKCRHFKQYWWCIKHDEAIRKGDYSCCKDFDAKETKK